MVSPRSAAMTRKSRAVPLKLMKSFSNSSIPSKRAAAMASSFSGSVPLSDTVAMVRRMSCSSAYVTAALHGASLPDVARAIEADRPLGRALAHRVGLSSRQTQHFARFGCARHRPAIFAAQRRHSRDQLRIALRERFLVPAHVVFQTRAAVPAHLQRPVVHLELVPPDASRGPCCIRQQRLELLDLELKNLST